MVDQASNREALAEAFDELIDSHELLHAAERSLEEYLAHNVPPEIPELFEDLEALLRYNAQKARYELGLSRLMERRAEHAAGYARAASRVEAFLPEGARLVHPYGGSLEEIPGGKRYLIYKERELVGDVSEAGVVPQETATGEVSAVAYVVRVEEMVTGSAEQSGGESASP
jgi:hypothetical protein